MSGILTEDGKHSLTAHEVRHSRIVFLVFLFLMSFSSWTGSAISSLSQWHAMTLTN